MTKIALDAILFFNRIRTSRTRDAVLYAGNFVTGDYIQKRIAVPSKKNGTLTTRAKNRIEDAIDEMLEVVGCDLGVWASFVADTDKSATDRKFREYMRRYRESAIGIAKMGNKETIERCMKTRYLKNAY